MNVVSGNKTTCKYVVTLGFSFSPISMVMNENISLEVLSFFSKLWFNPMQIIIERWSNIMGIDIYRSLYITPTNPYTCKRRYLNLKNEENKTINWG